MPRPRAYAERNARSDRVLPSVPGADLCVPVLDHQPLPESRERQRLPVRGGLDMTDVLPASEAHADHHPIGLIVTDDLQRSRLTVFFRLLLALPHLIVVALWAILTDLIVIVAWACGVVMGRVPDGLHNFIAMW